MAGIQSGDDAFPTGADPQVTALAVEAKAPDVALAARGDTAAFERVYRAHVARVQALARWLLDGEDVDDAVQDIFIRVWEKLDTYSGQAAFSTWLHRVAVNHLVRRRKRRSTRQAREVLSEEGVGGAMAPASRPDLRVAIEAAVERLPAGAREVFVLHDMEGYKHEEIAGLLGVDPGTSRSQLHRARMLLRKHLES